MARFMRVVRGWLGLHYREARELALRVNDEFGAYRDGYEEGYEAGYAEGTVQAAAAYRERESYTPGIISE